MMVTVDKLFWDATCPFGKHQREHNQSIIPYLEMGVHKLSMARYRSPLLLNLSIWCDFHVRHMLVEMPQSGYRPVGHFFMKLRHSSLGPWALSVPPTDANTMNVPIDPSKPNTFETMDDKGRVKTLEVRCGGDERVLIFITNPTDATFLGR
jgi:hypothetical protein